ncbi:MAG: hypothetical protein ACE5JP_18660, partial [Candidatus Bipolaricaulia bacterium]
MTSKERIRRAMHHEEPDRVPVMCQLSLGHYFLNVDIPTYEIWFSTEGFAEALITLQRRYRFDGILINLMGSEPGWERQLDRVEENEDNQILHWKNGDYTVMPRDDNPH